MISSGMRKLVVALFALVAAAGLVRAEKFRVGDLGEIQVVAAGQWKITAEDLGDKLEIIIAPTGPANASAAIRVNLVPEMRFETKGKLRTQVRRAGEPLAADSVEGKVVLQDYYRTEGYGCYWQFTDPNRIGRPPVKGDYTVMSSGLIRLARGVVASVTLVADDFMSPEYQSLLGAAEGMVFTAAVR